MAQDLTPEQIVRQSALIHPDWDVAMHHEYLSYEEFISIDRASDQRMLDRIPAIFDCSAHGSTLMGPRNFDGRACDHPGCLGILRLVALA